MMMQYHVAETCDDDKALRSVVPTLHTATSVLVLSSNHVSSSEERGLTRLYSILGSEEGMSSGQYR